MTIQSMVSSAIVSLVVIMVITALGVTLAVLVSRGKRAAPVATHQKLVPRAPRYAFVINPSKPHARQLRERIASFCTGHGLADVSYYETTLDRDGGDCARDALNDGADVVIAVGGDGTVRTVASAVANSGRSMAVVPTGTGNLFARNMGIPLDDPDRALEVAVSDAAIKVDMGRMALLDSDEPEHQHGFLVVAGMGFDALMIGDTNPKLKENISWLAYFAGGVKHLFAPKYTGDLTITDAEGHEHRSEHVEFRTFLAGNCGEIPAFTLMPAADFADGLLDFEMIDTTGGLLGWFNLFGDVITQTITRKPEQNPLSTNSTVRQIQGLRAEIRLERPALAQVDGDVLGQTRHVAVCVQRHALTLRVPAPVGR